MGIEIEEMGIDARASRINKSTGNDTIFMADAPAIASPFLFAADLPLIRQLRLFRITFFDILEKALVKEGIANCGILGL